MSRVLIISDIHGNIEALKSVLEEKFDYVVVSGDLVDYGPDPDLVIEKIIDLKPIIVQGNHDAANAYGIDCKCSEKLHDLSVYTRNFYKYKLNKNEIVFLRNLPMVKNFEIEGLKFTLVHASLIDPLYDYVLPSIDDNELIRKFKFSDSDFIIFGHTHLTFIRSINKSKFVNPGSVGQPRDGNWLASYAIINTDNKEIKLMRKKYNINETIGKINSLEMDKKYKEMLVSILKNGSI